MPSTLQHPARRLFISYARADRRFAVRLTRDLHAHGVETWRDEASIPVGEEWDASIEEGIRTCPEFLIVLSAKSVKSAYVRKELDCAIENQKPLVPVLYSTCKTPFELRRIQQIDFRGSYKAGFEQLIGNPPPVLSGWERILIRLSRLPWLRPFTAALAVFVLIAAMAVWWLAVMPSRTSIRVTDANPDAIVAYVHNAGGRAATLLGGSHWIRFGDLPIEDQELVLKDPATMSRVPGHRQPPVHFIAFGLVPKPQKDGTYVCRDELLPLMRGKPLALETRIEETKGVRTQTTTFPAEVIQSFVQKQYPGHVPGRKSCSIGLLSPPLSSSPLWARTARMQPRKISTSLC